MIGCGLTNVLPSVGLDLQTSSGPTFGAHYTIRMGIHVILDQGHQFIWE